jgi:hypothetical protein
LDDGNNAGVSTTEISFENIPFLAKTIVLDLVCFAILEANNKSSTIGRDERMAKGHEVAVLSARLPR